MIVNVDGEKWYLHFYHDTKRGSTRCRVHRGDCAFHFADRKGECSAETPFRSAVAAKRGKDADQFTRYKGRRIALGLALDATLGAGMGRGLRTKIWRAYWAQVDPPLALSKRERREGAVLVPMGSGDAFEVVRAAIHFAHRVCESLDSGMLAEARAYVSDVEGELLSLLPDWELHEPRTPD